MEGGVIVEDVNGAIEGIDAWTEVGRIRGGKSLYGDEKGLRISGCGGERCMDLVVVMVRDVTHLKMGFLMMLC